MSALPAGPETPNTDIPVARCEPIWKPPFPAPMKLAETFVLSGKSLFLAIIVVSANRAFAQPPPASQQDPMSAVLLITSGSVSGSGFACVYKNREFIATNLHVIEDAKSLSIKSQNGGELFLSGQMAAAGDADICLLQPKESFAAAGIVPLELIDNASDQSQPGDEVICLGNSLGNGVIAPTPGRIKELRRPVLEIDSPADLGNSGGPVIHLKTGKVIGLVTDAVVNQLTFEIIGVAPAAATSSHSTHAAYFVHRIDTVKDWTRTTLVDYQKAESILEKADSGLVMVTLFLAEKDGVPDGWEKDIRLRDNWRVFQKALDNAKSAAKMKIKVKDHSNEFGIVVRRDANAKDQDLGDPDYIKAREKFIRGIEWKILTDQDTLKRLKPIGFRQKRHRAASLDFTAKVLKLSKSL